MAYYYPDVLGKDSWFYIVTHFFGSQYIAKRCGMKIAELKDYVFSWDGKDSTLEHALFCSGAMLDASIGDELFVSPSYQMCKGSYRICKQRLPIKDLIRFLNDVSLGGDITFGDFLSVEHIQDRVFVFAHFQFKHTHLIEIDSSWGSSDNIEELLDKKLLGFQGSSVLSSLSLTILEVLIETFDNLDNPQDYYRAVNDLHDWANRFEYAYPFIKRQVCKEPDFFLGTCYTA